MVEDKILEYLDGSLSDRESAELLETLSVSPEKRALLEEHLRLKDVLALGRKPFTVPIETERSLAERIPILGTYEEEAVPWTGRFTGVRVWLGARGIRVATAAAILVLAVAGWYAFAGGNSSSQLNGPSAGSAHSTDATSAAPAAASNDQASATLRSTNDLAPSTAARDSHTAGVQRILRSGSASYYGVNRNASTVANNPVRASLSHEDNAQGMSDPISSVAALPPTEEPACAIPVGHFSHTMSELLLAEPGKVSPLSVGGSFVLNQLYLPVSSGPSHSILAPTEELSLDYNLSPSFAVGLDAGTAQGTSLANSGTFQTLGNNYSRITENSLTTNQTFYDLLLSTHFTLFPESAYQIRIGVAGGDAFGAGPVAEASAGVSRVIAPNLIFDLTATLGRVWTSGNPSGFTPPSSDGVVGIVGQQAAPTSLYSTAVGISAGLRMRLPE